MAEHIKTADLLRAMYRVAESTGLEAGDIPTGSRPLWRIGKERMMERKTVKIPQGAPIGPNGTPIYGYLELSADCMGGLCVHKTGKGARWKWMVTHEKSGLALERIGAMSKALAVENMQKALALEFDWNQDEKATLAALRQSRGIVDAITSIGNRH